MDYMTAPTSLVRSGLNVAGSGFSFATSNAVAASSYVVDPAARLAKGIKSTFTLQTPPDFWDDEIRTERDAFSADIQSGRYDHQFHPFELGIGLPEDAHIMPDSFHRVELVEEGQVVPCIYVEAKDAKAPAVTDVFFSGLLSTTPYYVPRLLERSEQNMASLIVNFPDPMNSIGYMPYYSDIYDHVTLSPSKEIRKVLGSGARTLSGHSTGSFMPTKAFLDDAKARHITKEFESATLMALFSIAMSADNPLKWIPYEYLYVPFVANEGYGHTVFDGIHSYFCYDPDVRSSKRDLTHGQVKYMVREGRELLRAVTRNGFSEAVHNFPINILHGTEDWIAHPERALKDLGNAMNARAVSFSGVYHSVPLESKEAARQWDRETLCASRTFQMHARNQERRIERHPQLSPSAHAEELRRFRGSLESGAGTLNPAASFT